MSTVDIFDDIIVGAGSAGIPLAARLSLIHHGWGFTSGPIPIRR